MLYSENDKKAVNTKLLTYSLITAGAVIVLFIVYLVFLNMRNFWVSFIFFALMICAVIFMLQEIIIPSAAYKKFLAGALSGRGMEYEVTFIRQEPDLKLRHGKMFNELFFMAEDDGLVERKAYVELSKLNFKPAEGENYRIKTLDNYIIGMERKS